MKIKILTCALTMLMAGTLIMGCDTAAKKADAAEVEVEEARQELKEAQLAAKEAANKVATAAEWNAFKIDTEAKITKNEKRIVELRVKLNRPGTAMDKSYATRIDNLEIKNKDLRMRMGTYEKNQSNWESFKREFDHDMDELGKALSDFTENNKN